MSRPVSFSITSSCVCVPYSCAVRTDDLVMVLAHSFTPELKKDYDLMKEADWKSINIASGHNPDVTEGIADPYADQSVRIKVPDLVYSQPAPYKTEVVEIGEHTLGKVRLLPLHNP